MCDHLVKSLIENALQSLSPEGQAVEIESLPVPETARSSGIEMALPGSERASCSCNTGIVGCNALVGPSYPHACNAHRRAVGGQGSYANKNLLRIGAVDGLPLTESNDLRWLKQLLRVAETLAKEENDMDAKAWMVENGDGVRRRIRHLEEERDKVVYQVAYDPRPECKPQNSTMTFAAYYAQPHGALEVKKKVSPGQQSWRSEAGPHSYEIRPVYPNRALHDSDIVRYRHVEMTNTMGLPVKEHLLRTAHQHRCVRCGTAQPCLFRYFADDEDESRYPERRGLHIGALSYEGSPNVAQTVAKCMAQLHSTKEMSQLEKDMAHRHELTTAACQVISSTHRLRQPGIFTGSPHETGVSYVRAYRAQHLEPEVHLPPVTRGDGHEGHFYL